MIATLHYAEIFPLVQIRIPVWRFFLMATVPILGRISESVTVGGNEPQAVYTRRNKIK